jgi:hypothetical protein
VVQEEDVDAVGAQALQTGLDRAAHVAAIRATCIGILAGGVEALGRDHQVVPAAADQLAQDFLRLAGVVLVGGIEKVDTRIAGGAEHAGRLRRVGIAAERHRSHAKLGNLHAGAAKRLHVHPISLA